MFHRGVDLSETFLQIFLTLICIGVSIVELCKINCRGFDFLLDLLLAKSNMNFCWLVWLFVLFSFTMLDTIFLLVALNFRIAFFLPNLIRSEVRGLILCSIAFFQTLYKFFVEHFNFSYSCLFSLFFFSICVSMTISTDTMTIQQKNSNLLNFFFLFVLLQTSFSSLFLFYFNCSLSLSWLHNKPIYKLC